jgi:hypothetical protein
VASSENSTTNANKTSSKSSTTSETKEPTTVQTNISQLTYAVAVKKSNSTTPESSSDVARAKAHITNNNDIPRQVAAELPPTDSQGGAAQTGSQEAKPAEAETQADVPPPAGDADAAEEKKRLNVIDFSETLTMANVNVDPDQVLPRPDGKKADLSKPIKVFILMGQSNMLGFGTVHGGDGSLEHAVKVKKRFPHLFDDNAKWTTLQNVRNVRVMHEGGEMKLFKNEWLTVNGRHIGVEIQIGHILGQALGDEPVLLIKSCIGNRSLGWDLLPPGSKQFEHGGFVYAGYKESPEKWKKGEEPKPIGWYAGKASGLLCVCILASPSRF